MRRATWIPTSARVERNRPGTFRRPDGKARRRRLHAAVHVSIVNTITGTRERANNCAYQNAVMVPPTTLSRSESRVRSSPPPRTQTKRNLFIPTDFHVIFLFTRTFASRTDFSPCLHSAMNGRRAGKNRVNRLKNNSPDFDSRQTRDLGETRALTLGQIKKNE